MDRSKRNFKDIFDIGNGAYFNIFISFEVSIIDKR